MTSFADTDVASMVARHGFAVVPDVVSLDVVDRFCSLVDQARSVGNAENVSNRGGTYGLRNLTDVIPETAELARHPRIRQLVESVIGARSFVVRSTLFDKTQTANWGVFWHQDLSIAVQERCDVSGFGSWTKKAGVACVQPPVEIMQNILAVRLHLDDCTVENGALKVLPGTHRLQKLNAAELESQQTQVEEQICEVPAGGIVLMRPLLLHASSPMEKPTSRRVIHLEFANFELPNPLEWKFRITD